MFPTKLSVHGSAQRGEHDSNQSWQGAVENVFVRALIKLSTGISGEDAKHLNIGCLVVGGQILLILLNQMLV